MLAEECLLVNWGCPCQYVGCATGVTWADEWVLGDKCVLGRCQDETNVAVLAPAAGTLDCVCGAGVVSPLTGGLLTFLQVGLRFDEMCLEFSPGLFLLWLGLSDSAVFRNCPVSATRPQAMQANFPSVVGLTAAVA